MLSIDRRPVIVHFDSRGTEEPREKENVRESGKALTYKNTDLGVTPLSTPRVIQVSGTRGIE